MQMTPTNVYLIALMGMAITYAKETTTKERLTIDGRQFTINQKDFRPAKFAMYGKEYDDTYGFVSPSYLPLDNRGFAEVIEQCDFEADSVPMSTYSELSTLNYYPHTPAYDTFKGYDMIPENKDHYVAGSDFAANLNFKDGKRKFYDETIMMQRCRLPQDDRGAWHVQRIGPFISTGGYDWWQLSYPDVGMFSEALKKYPEGIDVTRQIFTPVLKDGTRLNFPPIHTHHIHVLHQPGVRPRLNMSPMCLQRIGLGIDSLDKIVAQTRCYNLSIFFEQHGDHICQPIDDGLDCLTQGDKTTRRLVQAVDLEGELNDVRPFNSDPLEWYYQVAMRWKPADKTTEPVSHMLLMGPGFIFPPSQLTKAFTFPAPTHAQSVLTYTSKLIDSGELIRMKLHAHAGIFESAMVLRGVPTDFGIGSAEFIPPLPGTALITTELGFRDNEDLAQHILYHMKKSQEVYDRDCVDKKNLRNEMCKRPRPDWMGGAVVDTATVEFAGVEYQFDRRPKTWSKPWTFKAGEDFVAISFNKHVTKPPAPHAPDVIPTHMLQHLTFIMNYEQAPGTGHSMFHVLLSGYNGPFYNFHTELTPPMVMARLVAIILWQGPPLFSGNMDLLEWFFVAIFTAMAGGVVYLLFMGLRKVPAFDRLFVATAGAAHRVLSTTSLALESQIASGAAVSSSDQAHAYEMVSVVEDDDVSAESS